MNGHQKPLAVARGPARWHWPGLSLVLSACLLVTGCDRGPAEPSVSSAAGAGPAPAAPPPVSPTATPAERAQAIQDNAPALAQGRAEAVDSVTAMLRHDAPAVVRALARSPASASGTTLAHWARALWKADQVDPLALGFTQLALGPAMNQDAVQVFSATTAAADGSVSYANAAAMGYFVGALEAGLAASGADDAKRQEKLVHLLRSAARQVGVPTPDASAPADNATAAARWVRFNVYPLLASQWTTDDPLFWSAQPMVSSGVQANGELRLESAAGSAAKGAFFVHWKRTRRALDNGRS